MPQTPDAIEQMAPIRKATAVMIPMGPPARSGTSATSRVSTTAITTPMITAPTSASTPIVVYWRLTKASAPSRIVSPTSRIAWVPVSRDSTSRAR
jgi:hypothetical protein